MQYSPSLIPLSMSGSAADVLVPPQGKVIVPTDIALAVPDGCYGRVGMAQLASA